MKRITVIIVLLMSVGKGYCASDLHALPLTLTVQSAWGMTLNPPITAINFGNLQPGVESDPVVASFEVQANHGMEWVVALQANPITHTDGTTVIPAPNFQYFHTYDNPDGVETPAAGTAVPVPTAEQNVFVAGPAIYNTQFTGFGLGFKIITPPDQKSGDYTTVVNVRMIDGF